MQNDRQTRKSVIPFSRRLRMLFAVWFVTAIATAARCHAAAPNILFILADDLGWRDLGCYGSTFYETPNIDRLAASGMKFTAAYTACPVCSPTRASLMTGQYQTRLGITDYISNSPSVPTNRKLLTRPNGTHLAHREVTIGEILKAGGYETYYAGKWHLGTKEFEANSQGFDHYVGDDVLGDFANDWQVSDRLTDAAIGFLNKHDSSKPFFMFLSYHEPHRPVLEYPRYIEHFRKKAASLTPPASVERKEHNGITRTFQNDPAYGSEIAAMDGEVGKVLDKLETMGLTEKTIVIFFSDNGGLSTLQTAGPTSNEPLRAGKAWLYEGGIRVPLIVRAPGITRRGTQCHVPVCSIDLAPTITDLVHLVPQPDYHKDGYSLTGLLRGGKPPSRTTLYWHYPHYHNSTTWRPGGAIRDDDWKLIEFFEDNSIELYNLKADLSEQQNVAALMPDKVRELRRKLSTWRSQTNAVMPTGNPTPSPETN